MKTENTLNGKSALEMCGCLKFPPAVKKIIGQIAPVLPWEELAPLLSALEIPDTAEQAMKNIGLRVKSLDADGFASLSALLAASCRTRLHYRELGIPDSVFLDTLNCLPRMVNDSYLIEGRWLFDKSFWVWRQISGTLFRLKTLEFEYCKAHMDLSFRGSPFLSAGEPVISVHIPSDASLSDEALKESYSAAGEFFARFGEKLFPRLGAPRAVLCDSWLLSPALLPLLSENSGIRRFAGDYEVVSVKPDDEGFYYWLFGGKKPPEQLPQKSSLQRAAKEKLLRGETIGSGCGFLRNSFLA